jgi:NADH dehydrogenase
LILLPGVEVVEANIFDRATLSALVAQGDAVINCVGILHSRRGDPYGPDFAKLHVDLPRHIADAMKIHGITRLLHISALGAATDAPSMYLRSKADGEVVLKAERGLDVTIFRPSVVFGAEDNFMNLFARLARWLPFLFIGHAEAQFQPVSVEEVALAVVHALENRNTHKKIYKLCGPKVYTLRELVRYAAAASGHPRCIMGLPDSLAYAQAWLLEHMPGGPLMSRDNIDSMKVPSVAPKDWKLAPDLSQLNPRSIYNRFRARARR